MPLQDTLEAKSPGLCSNAQQLCMGEHYTEEDRTPASRNSWSWRQKEDKSFPHRKMDFQAYVFAEWPPRRQIPWSHPQSVLVEEARLGWDHRTSGAHLISSNLLPNTPSTNLEEAQQRDRWYLGKPSSNHKDRQNACQIKAVHPVHDVIACQARVQTRTITWFKKT